MLNYRSNLERPFRVLVAMVAVCAFWMSIGTAPAAEPRQVAADMAKQYATELEKLAAWCDEQGLAEQAAETRRRTKPAAPDLIRVPILPDEVGKASALTEDTPEKIAEWHKRFWKLRHDQAQKYFQYAAQVIRSGHASLAIDLVHRAIVEDPDNAAARRLLGYHDYKGRWCTPYEVNKYRSGQVWDDRFGWIRKKYLPRYEQGERFYRGKWITAEQDKRIHGNIHNGWDIETEHYQIRTNHSIEAGVRLGKKLEELYDVWRRLFLSFHATPRQIESMFSRRGGRVSPKQYKIVYLHSRNEYNQALRGAMPNIDKSEGVYVAQMHRVYCFDGTDTSEETLLHEATHQLFHESRRVANDVGESANCWVVEAIAVFMETLRKQDDFYVVGGFDVQRMRAARYRLLHDKFYIPFDQLTRYGFNQLQNDPKIRTIYSQIAGWGQFLIFYDNGRYRDVMIDYLTAVYDGSQDPTILSRLSRTSYDQLDRQYHEFIEQIKP